MQYGAYLISIAFYVGIIIALIAVIGMIFGSARIASAGYLAGGTWLFHGIFSTPLHWATIALGAIGILITWFAVTVLTQPLYAERNLYGEKKK